MARSVILAKAISRGKVCVRNARTGQLLLKFRKGGKGDRIISPYPVRDLTKRTSYTNLSQFYSAEDLKRSNLEDLFIQGDLELAPWAFEEN